MTRYLAEYAWLGADHLAERVLIEVDGDRIGAVVADADPPSDAALLRGVTIPGLANAHSHAFHRALRGRTHRAGGSFWTWREEMYAAAGRLTPGSCHALARATYAEMALAGITCVGEFHYVHHDAGGRQYAEPNAMGDALIAAAAEAGIRITLLDACYLAGGFGAPPEGVQQRFADADAEAWAARASTLRLGPHARAGAAIHSVRAVPAEQIAPVAAWARDRDAPLHFHLSEQRAENEACLAAHECTPAELLEAHGALGAGSCAVHATHLSDGDVALLGATATAICMCPTTERDLADGIGPAAALSAAGAPLCAGSDSHAVIDPFEEVRAIELDERLASGRRGRLSAPALLRAASADGHAALGWPQAGRIEAGAIADLVTVGTDSVRLAGATADTLLESLVFAATAADVRDVVAGGRRIVGEGRHLLVPDVAGELRASIAAVVG